MNVISLKLKVVFCLSAVFFLFSCKNPFDLTEETDTPADCEVVIGDEMIYGKEFSFSSLYTSQARAAAVPEENMIEMAYFSVCPTSADSVMLVNDTFGYLNPAEMNKEIIQTCDADTIVFKKDVSGQIENYNPDDLLNLGIKYYYIDTKENVENYKELLENLEVIEEFSMPEEEVLETSDEESVESARWIFSKVFSKYSIRGKVYYNIEGCELPAYGLKISREGNYKSNTDINGNFSLGSKRNCWGLCWIYANYENSACTLSNVLNITASTLLKVDWPSKLTNVTIKADSGYAKTKMAVCNELLTRYNEETKTHGRIPQARVWTTQAGNGISSAPCFQYLLGIKLPDIFLSNCSRASYNNLCTLHHEYTHYLHNVYCENKNNFWNSVIFSEIGSTLSNISVDLVNAIFSNADFEKKYPTGYDFSNKYVCFTENLAEWYSYHGLSKGPFGKKANLGLTARDINRLNIYVNQGVFKNLIYQNICSATDIILLIDKYDITTFNDFYKILLRIYPTRKTTIVNTFKSYYIPYGNEIEY